MLNLFNLEVGNRSITDNILAITKSANSCWWAQLLVITLHDDIAETRASDFSLSSTGDSEFLAVRSTIIFGSHAQGSLLYKLATFSYYVPKVFQGLFNGGLGCPWKRLLVYGGI